MQAIAATSQHTPQVEGQVKAAVRSKTTDAVAPVTVSAPSEPPVASAVEIRQAEIRQAEIRQAIDAANASLKQVTSDLEFAMDSATGKTVLRVIDAGTRQILRQFPSEEMLAIGRALDRFHGFLITQKA